ncbi:MAG: squalene/phytoene synthase family protein [Pseudomonadota bacterium]
MSDWHACAALVERGDSARFRAAMAAPAKARAALFPIYAMALEVSRAPWVTQEPMIAEMRLQWWRDALEEIKEGREVRSHEVTVPLAQVLTGAGAAALDDLIVARRWDIYKDAFEDAAHFTDYLEKTSGNMLFAACDALGRSDKAVCRDAGYALGLARFFQAVPELEAQRRVPLLDGRPEAIAELARGGLARLRAARAARGKVHAAVMISCWEAERLLSLAAKKPGLVARGALQISRMHSAARLTYVAVTGRW